MEPPRRVLIVDDDEYSRRTASDLLSPGGYDTCFARSGAEALEVAHGATPDLVLMDVMMPGMTGFETCQRLRQLFGEEHVPIVLLTALDEQREVLQGLKAGADDFLRKPVNGAELRMRVANLLKVRAYHQLLTAQRDEALQRADALRQQLLRADRLAVLGTFAASVSHEMNNIAQVLKAVLDEFPPVTSQDGSETHQLLSQATQHVAELSRALLRVARPKEEQDPQVDLGQALAEVRDMLRLTGRTRHVSVQLQRCEAPCRVRASPVHAQQVFLNLLANAADALVGTPQPRIEAGVRPLENGRVEAWVQDNGPGMSEEVLARAFEPFFTTKPEGQGTGLGLPIVRQLVDSWDGLIRIHSQPGQGTRIHLEFPAASSPRSSP